MWRAIGAAAAAFVVVFWNVECLFDCFDDPAKDDDEFLPVSVRHWTWSRFEKKRDGIVQTILAAGDLTGDLPALVGLAEVENQLVVSRLVRKTLLEELDYGFVHRESPDARGIDVALLYRKDVLRVLTVDSLRVPGVVTRDILYVKMKEIPDQARNDGGEYHVFVVHLPSKYGGTGASGGKRAAARRVLDHAVDSLLRLDSLSRILVMGDFNDTDNTVTGLCKPSFEAPPAAPGTLKYHGRWEKIDEFFVSPALSASAAMQILALPFLLEEDPVYRGVKPRRTYIGPRYNGGLSDHLPIILRFFY